jgi:hypothetical protein
MSPDTLVNILAARMRLRIMKYLLKRKIQTLLYQLLAQMISSMDARISNQNAKLYAFRSLVEWQ